MIKPQPVNIGMCLLYENAKDTCSLFEFGEIRLEPEVFPLGIYMYNDKRPTVIRLIANKTV